MRSLRPSTFLLNCSTAALATGFLCGLCWVSPAQAQTGSAAPNTPAKDLPMVPKAAPAEPANLKAAPSISKPVTPKAPETAKPSQTASSPAKAESVKSEATKSPVHGPAASSDKATAAGSTLAAPKPPDAKTKAAAKKASTDGEKAYKAADFATALTHFEESEALIPSAAAEFWIADCLDKLGRLDEALPSYSRFLANPSVEKSLVDKRTIAEARVTQLNATVPGKSN